MGSSLGPPHVDRVGTIIVGAGTTHQDPMDRVWIPPPRAPPGSAESVLFTGKTPLEKTPLQNGKTEILGKGM